MIPATHKLVFQLNKEYGPFAKVLDVGSLVVANTGHSLRGFFPDSYYWGVDMRPGQNVDQVINGHDLSKELKDFDLVMCFDMLEHDNQFWVSVAEMKKVLKKGGLLVIGVPGIQCPLHEYPCDYYRFTNEAVKEMFSDMELLGILNLENNGEIQGIGRKL
jgi:SAM-dependent methyltransferase